MRHNVSFHVIGVSHHTAGVEVRERFAFTPAELAILLEREAAAGRSALFLSTCNRSEVYWGGDHDLEPWFREFARERGVTDESAITRFDGEAAVRHLFTVAAGLDSQILGETEILGQIRRAYDAARATGATTRDMDMVFSAALSGGRRVRRETMLGRHPTSVSSAAVGLVDEQCGGIASRRIVVLGAGEAAEGVLRALHERGAARTLLVNRGSDRAKLLAAAWGASAGAWGELDEALALADVLFVATAAARPVVTAERLARAVAQAPGRANRELIVVDLAVPRNVEPTARSISGIALLDLDDLQRLRCPAAGAPAAALAEAERVLAEELDRLDCSLRGRAAAPRLAELHRRATELAEQETTWALTQLQSLSESERQIVRDMAARLVRRVLYPVSRAVRSQDPTAL